MKTRLLIIIAFTLIPLITPNVSALCAAEALEWWEACNDTGPTNALPFNPLLLFVVFPVVIIVSLVGIVFWRKRK